MGKIRELFTAKDMTAGTPWKRIAEFAFPMILGNFAQQLYNTVDAIVVGRSEWGYTALAAVGNANPIINLLLALFVGVATGAGIMVSQYYGAKDREKLTKIIGNCFSLTAIATLLIMVVGTALVNPLLKAMNTLPDIYQDSRDYLMIFFIGIGGFMFYNIAAGILRGLGDSFSALLFLMVCAALNIVGDVLLVGPLGVRGVAYATVISQIVSAVLCVIKLLRMKDIFELHKEDLRPESRYIGSIIRLGIPSGITQAVFSCSMLLVQALINSFGDTMMVAANVMVMRVDGYAMLPNMSFGQAMGTYAGQNIGAGKLGRVREGSKQGVIMGFITSIVLTPIILFFGPDLMRLFTPDNEELVSMAMSFMYILCPGYIMMSFVNCWQGVVRGCGDTTTPMWISIFNTVVMRIGLAYGMVAWSRSMGHPLALQEKMVFISLIITWTVGLFLNMAMFYKGKWRKNMRRFVRVDESLIEE